MAANVSTHSSTTGTSAVPALTTRTRAVGIEPRRPPQQAAGPLDRARVDGQHGLALGVVGAGEQHRATAVGEQLADDLHALLG